MPVIEIMALHDWPADKARNLIARGMADLRQRLEDDGHGADHPGEERWEAFALGELSATDAATVTSHAAGCEPYGVRIYRDTGELLDTVRTTEPELRLTQPRGSYRLEVEAIGPAGILGRSRSTQFSITR